MKRRNAETGKMRRPIKRTKITEGMYGNSLLYLKFVMLWATVVLADYMLEFRFEFLWPFWMMLRSVYDSFKYQGLAFSVFFICIALTSDMICFFFMPMQWMLVAASTYVWVQCIWYTVVEKGLCMHSLALCCMVSYVEVALRAVDRGGGIDSGGLELCRPLAAHCVGYPVVTLGFGFKSYVGHRLRLRRQRQVRAQNEYFYRILREALPESALEENVDVPSPKPAAREAERVPSGGPEPPHEHKHMNGSAGAPGANGTPGTAAAKSKKWSNGLETNRHCPHEHSMLQYKLERIEKHLATKVAAPARDKDAPSLSNGNVTSPHDAPAPDDVKHEHCKASAKSTKCEKKENSVSLKEEKRRNKNKDKDKEIADSHKSTEPTKEVVKDAECTKENISAKSSCSHANRDREREKEREKEREREREKLEREREKEQRLNRECIEELKRVRAELTASKVGEEEARRALAAAAAAERARRADHLQLKHAHTQLQHKLTTWRSTERATLDRRLGEERRLRTAVEQQLQRALQQATRQNTGECSNEWCVSRRGADEAEAASLRRELSRCRERSQRDQRDLQHAADQIRALEASREESSSPRLQQQSALTSALSALQERAAHLERALSAETRVKLDLLSALGEAKRQLHIREGLIAKQEKELEELKAQMLAVMPSDFMTPVSAGSVSKLRRAEGSPLDPNASVYTPKQLCSDA